MENSKLIRLISALKAKELQELKHFLDSRLSNCGSNESQLFEVIATVYSSGGIQELKKLTKDEVKVKLFPNRELKKQDSSMRKSMSELAKCVEEYLIYAELRNNQLKKKYFLFDALMKRGLHKDAETLLNQSRKKMNAKIDDFHFYDNYKIAHFEHELCLNTGNRANKKAIQNLSEHFDNYFIVSKLEMFCAALNKQNVLGVKDELRWMPEVLDYIKRYDLLDNPLIQMYYVCCSLLDTRNKKYFTELINVLKKYNTEVSKRVLHYFYTTLLNYCTVQVRRGNDDYVKEAFCLYKQILLEDLPLGSAQVWQHHFKNIVTTASRLKEFEWASQFIQDYKHKLPNDTKEDMVHYNEGTIRFYRGDYRRALDTFNKISTIDPFYHINKEMRLIKIYYELGELNSLRYKLNTFRTYIRRNGHVNKKHYINFINVMVRLHAVAEGTKRLSRSNPKTDRLQKRLGNIKRDILMLKPLVDKKWLLKNIELAEQKIEQYKERQRK